MKGPAAVEPERLVLFRVAVDTGRVVLFDVETEAIVVLIAVRAERQILFVV